MSDNLRQQLVELPNLLGHHIQLTLIALVAAIAISFPAALLCLRVPRVRGTVLAVVSVIQTVPSLALLALMAVAFGLFDQRAALIALTAYAILPILRNMVTGILGVDASVIEAARGVGMTPWQILRQVELPLAAPVIIAGIRTATVWVVGIATLSTPVGADSLGNYIFSGLQTTNTTRVVTGVVAAIVLALILDQLIRLLEHASERRSLRLGLTGVGGLLVVLIAGLAPLAIDLRDGPVRTQVAQTDQPRLERVTIGAKTFTEQFILARLLGQTLADAGYDIELKESLGSIIAFEQLAQDELQIYVDYTGTIWANQMDRTDSRDPTTVLFEMTAWLARTHGITCLGPLGFENAYALAMRAADAEALNLRTVSDLEPHAAGLTIGSDYEFFARPEWQAFLAAYGFTFAETSSFDSTLMYPAVAQGKVDVITAFTTDARIIEYDLALLQDPRRAFPPYDAVLLLSDSAAQDPLLVDTLRPLINAINVSLMRAANGRVDLEGRTPRDAAAWLRSRLPQPGE
ncbi:MAG: ABC transporter permease/substrate-binding protein [Planctomycetota bacterium]